MALCVILCFTLFRTHNIELDFHNQTTIFAEEGKREEVIGSANINTRVPIFSLNKKNIMQNLEQNNPYLKIINIETIFPNKLVIHCAEREEMFCIKSNNDLYYVCDEELKILNITRSVNFEQGNAVLLNGVNILNSGASTGEFLEFSAGSAVLKTLASAFAHSNKTISDFKGMFKEMMLSYEYNVYSAKMSPTFDLTTYDDFDISIKNAESFLATKLNLMLSTVPQKPEYYATHTLVIDINPNDINQQYIALEKN